jgi:di/tricarboxylate transporter
MTGQAWTLSAILVVTLALFVWGRLKPEIVALLALLASAVTGIVSPEAAFSGFGHPAVITVAAVFVLSQALTSAGLVEYLAQPLRRLANRPFLLLTGMTASVALLSAFINNVGALAVFMPIALALARECGRPPSMFLMPLAFGSLLGGMTTLIGTPPNMIVASFRAKATGEPFAFFDFTPVGGLVAVCGIAAVVAGWRLIPRRTSGVDSEQLFKVGPYLTEVVVGERSDAAGQTLRDLNPGDVQILSIIRGDRRISAPSASQVLRRGDVLVTMGASDAVEKFRTAHGLDLAPQADDLKPDLLETDQIGLTEAVVTPHSRLVGSTAVGMRLRDRHGMNLLGIAREGRHVGLRVRDTPLRAGDVLLVQGNRSELFSELAELGCLPLADRPIPLAHSRRKWRALFLFAASIAAVTFGWMPPPVAFTLAALLMVLTGVLSLRRAYAAMEWPVLILLAAMLPVGLAIETAGLGGLIAHAAVSMAAVVPPWVMLLLLLAATMFLSDLVNNAAAAVMMCPIALQVARGLEASPDAFLMAVAIGASCAFLTPIGHQSNLLVMGPAGYRFGDYWRPGLVLEAVILAVAIPALLWFWPLG